MAEPFLKGGSKVLERLLDLEKVGLEGLRSSVNLDMAKPCDVELQRVFF